MPRIIIALENPEKDNLIHVQKALANRLVPFKAQVHVRGQNLEVVPENYLHNLESSIRAFMDKRKDPSYAAKEIYLFSDKEEKEDDAEGGAVNSAKYDGLLREYNRVNTQLTEALARVAGLEGEKREAVDLYVAYSEDNEMLKKEIASLSGKVEGLEKKIMEGEKSAVSFYLSDLKQFVIDHIEMQYLKVQEAEHIFKGYLEETERRIFEDSAKDFGLAVKIQDLPILVKETSCDWEETETYKVLHENYNNAIEEVIFLDRLSKEDMDIPKHIRGDLLEKLRARKSEGQKIIDAYDRKEKEFKAKKALCSKINQELGFIEPKKLTELNLTYFVYEAYEKETVQTWIKMPIKEKDSLIAKLLIEPLNCNSVRIDSRGFVECGIDTPERAFAVTHILRFKEEKEKGEYKFTKFGIDVRFVKIEFY